jgi:predicted transcriptional regulator
MVSTRSKGVAMVFLGEMRILMDVALNRCSAKQLINHRSALSNQFIGHSLDSLVRRGYLKKNGASIYQLTSFGTRVLLKSPLKNGVCDKRDFLKLLYEDEVRSKDAIRQLEEIRVEFVNKMDIICKKQL